MKQPKQWLHILQLKVILSNTQTERILFGGTFPRQDPRQMSPTLFLFDPMDFTAFH